MKHKHYDLILEWANGAKIQARAKREDGDDWDNDWWIDDNPQWNNEAFEFRVVPPDECPLSDGDIHAILINAGYYVADVTPYKKAIQSAANYVWKKHWAVLESMGEKKVHVNE